MNKIATEMKTVRDFSEYLIKEKCPLAPESMANEFLSFLSSQHLPTSYYWIESFCSEIGIDEIQYNSFPKNMRGFHSISPEGKITVVLEQSSYAGRVHTLYHEIYEIICELIDKPALKTERKANLFAASVIMPEKYFFEYAIRRGLMFSEIKTYYSEIATDSILLRINHLFRKRGLFHVAYLLKNIFAYARGSADSLKRMADFELVLSTLDKLDSIHNEDFTNKIINESIEKVLSLAVEDLSLVKFVRPKKIVLAEPILLHRNGAIKEIAIQIIDEDVYENFGSLLKVKQ